MSRPADVPDPAEIRGLAARLRRLTRFSIRDYGILVAIALLVVIIQSKNSSFLTQTNLFNIASSGLRSESWPLG